VRRLVNNSKSATESWFRSERSNKIEGSCRAVGLHPQQATPTLAARLKPVVVENEMSKQLQVTVAMALVASLAMAGVASAQWGDLKVKFVIDGKAPTLPPVDVTKDQAICTAGGKKKVQNEEFVVGADGGIKDVVMFLVPEKGQTVKAHPDYEKDAAAKVAMDNKGCAFVPHVLLVRTGQTLAFTNSDPTAHNSQFNFPENKKAENPLIPAKGEYSLKPADLAKRETRVQPVTCAIHPWMKGYILIQDHPYMATSDENGVLEIKNLPVGKHTFQMWQDGLGYVNPSSGLKGVSKGKVELTIKEGANDLGEVKVKPKSK
jgi:plastocyanin